MLLLRVMYVVDFDVWKALSKNVGDMSGFGKRSRQWTVAQLQKSRC